MRVCAHARVQLDSSIGAPVKGLEAAQRRAEAAVAQLEALKEQMSTEVRASSAYALPLPHKTRV